MEETNDSTKVQGGDECITVSEALNRTGIPWGDQPGAASERVQQIFGGEDDEFLEVVVKKGQFWDTTIIVPEHSGPIDNMKDQTMIAPHVTPLALVVAVNRVRVGRTWQIQGVLMDANYHLFRFLVLGKAVCFSDAFMGVEESDWAPGAFVKLNVHRVMEMALPQQTPVRPWMMLQLHELTPPAPNLPTSVEQMTNNHLGFIFHYSTINEVMAFGELWCQPHNWLDRKELAGSFTSTEDYLVQFEKKTGKHQRPAVAVVTSRANQLKYETRFVTRIDTWKNKEPLKKVYAGGCTCFSAFHCTECLAVLGNAIDPSVVSGLLDDDLKGDTESYEQWYINHIPGATASAPFPACLRAAIIDQTQDDLQRDIKEQVQNESKHDVAMQE